MAPIADRLFGWLPCSARERALRRLLVVWTVALAIALILWGVGGGDRALDNSLVYSYAISTAIWLFSDPMRIVLHRWLNTRAPHYWQPNGRLIVYMIVSSTAGYAAGTAIGDAYAGHSTWAMVDKSPMQVLGFWISGLLISGFFVLGFYQRARTQELHRQATEARLKLLESQLEPHMLFNTLANLRALIATDPSAAIRMLDRLNDFLRATLRATRSDTADGTHSLADEFTRLADYLELMAVRMGPRLRFAFEAPEDLRRHPVPPLLLQPLVENAIQHGLEPHAQGGTITVRASREGNHWLRIEIADTGVGIDPHAPATTTGDGGFGLAQVRERVASVAGGPGEVEVVSRPGAGTTIRLHLPLIVPRAAA